MESALTSHDSSKSNKKPSDGRGISDYLELECREKRVLQSCGARNFVFKEKKLANLMNVVAIGSGTVVKSYLIRVLSTIWLLAQRFAGPEVQTVPFGILYSETLRVFPRSDSRRRCIECRAVSYFIYSSNTLYSFICSLTNNLWFIIFLAKHQYKLFQMVSTPHKHTIWSKKKRGDSSETETESHLFVSILHKDIGRLKIHCSRTGKNLTPQLLYEADRWMVLASNCFMFTIADTCFYH
jgi:hypothetical protein